MVPPKTHPTWAALLQGRLEHKFGNAAASMLLFQLKSDLRKDSSLSAQDRATNTMHAFFTKYERTLQTDIKAIFN
jgi:hypothetical protein